MLNLPNEILARSRYLHERLAFYAGSSPQGVETSDDFQFWKKQFSVGGYDRFPARLQSLGISEQEAIFVAQNPGLGVVSVETDWKETLALALDTPAIEFEAANAFPFARIWLPLIAFAQNNLNRIAADPKLILPDGLNGLLVALIKSVSEFAAFPVYSIFSEFQSEGKTFDAFIQCVQDTGYLLLFERFPVLPRQLSRLLATWIDTVNLFLGRFQTDFREVQALVGCASADSRLAGTRMGMSDRHDGGQQVILLDFDDGSKTLYKPKNGSSSEALTAIRGWITGQGFNPGWRIAKVVTRPGYVWEEFIEQRACESADQVKRYYRSGGELLCLAYLLNAVDLWDENLIAAGDGPIPIDTECFFQPGRVIPEGNTLETHRVSLGTPSVIETGLLPCWQVSASHKPADYSGLGMGIVEIPDRKVTEWENINSDTMRPVNKPAPARRTANAVQVRGITQNVRDHANELIDGFCSLYRFILARKEALAGFIEQFGQTETRILYRPTQLYALLLQHARSASNLMSGIRQSSVFEQLYRVPLRDNHLTPEAQRLIDFEIESLLGLDIPRFRVRLDSRDLRSLNFCAPNVVNVKPMETVLERIAGITERDMRFQVEVITESLKRVPARVKKPVSAKSADSLACQFALEIRNRLNPPDHDFLWEPSSYFPPGMSLAQRQGIYLGDLGPLLFLAAADDLLGSEFFPQARALRLADQLNGLDFSSSYPLGICQGIGGLIYASLLLAKFTKRNDWRELALSLNDRVQKDSTTHGLDLTSGIAGFLLAAIRLFEATRAPKALTHAQAAARTLAKNFDPNSGWKHTDGNSYLGFAHGLAGIVFALEMYGRATLDQQYQPLIKEALALERKQFIDCSWPVAMEGARRTLKNWCNGAAGILMNRASTGALAPGLFPNDELFNLLEKIGQRGQTDHWCCGNFGIAEALSYIGQQASLPEAQKRSSILLEETLDRGLQSGFFRLQSSIGENFCFSPSLFRGTSGLGYSLLRFAHPGELPCILAFEV